MKITIEVDVQPDELRRFLGLPDIAGLQEDIIAYMKEKAAAAVDISPTDFVRQNLDSFGVTSTFRKFVHGAKKATGLGEDDDDEAEDDSPVPRRRRRGTASAPGGVGGGTAPTTASGAPRPSVLDDEAETLHSYDESTQATARDANPADETSAERDRETPSALDTAEEIGAALAGMSGRALRSLRARAPRFGFGLDAARERRAQSRPSSAHPEEEKDADESSEDASTGPAARAGEPAGTARKPAATGRKNDSGTGPAAPDADDVF